jgi:hypothetical protein
MRWRLAGGAGAKRRSVRRARPGLEDLEGRELLNGAPPVPIAAPPAQHAATVSIQSIGPKNVADMERNLTTPTAWYVYHGVDPTTLSHLLSQNQARLVDLQVDSTSPYRFTVAMVKNTGDYAKAWWWYYGISGDQLTTFLNNNHARLIDLETYQVNGATRFAAIMVANTGDDAKAWWYYVNVSPSFITQKLNANQARLVDIQRQANGNFTVVMDRNSGIDAEAWWWYYGVSAGQVNTLLQMNHARLTEFERQPDGNYTVLMVRNPSTRWYYYYGVTAQQVVNLGLMNHARVFDLDPYQVGGQTLFTTVMVGNP